MNRDNTILLLLLVVLIAKNTWQWAIIPELSCGSSKYSSFVSLATEDQSTHNYFCGGILISAIHVITTKKCAKGQADKLIYAFMANNTIKIEVNDITMHTKNHENRDIALLHLAKPIQSKDSVEPMCLPSIVNIGTILINNIVQSAEWEVKENKMSIINKNDMAVQTKEDCQRCYDQVNDLLCGKKSNRLTSVGGVIFKKMDQQIGEKYVLFGLIVEQKPNCNDNDLIGMIDISSYLVWIKNNMDLAGIEGGHAKRAKAFKCLHERRGKVKRRNLDLKRKQAQ